jgi:hypothetical protein
MVVPLASMGRAAVGSERQGTARGRLVDTARLAQGFVIPADIFGNELARM